MEKNVFAGVGISKDDDPFIAGKEAAEMAVKRMEDVGGKKPKFGLLFCSGGKYGKNSDTIKKLVDGAHSVFSKEGIRWMGCTTAGEISNYGITQKSVVSMVVSSEYIHAGIGVGNNKSKSPRKAGETAVKNALNDLKVNRMVNAYIQFLVTKKKPLGESIKSRPYMAFMVTPGGTFSKGTTYGDDILDSVVTTLGGHIPIFGGCSADDHVFKETYQFENGNVYKDAVVIMIMVCNLKFLESVKHGFKATDKYVIVTKAKDYLVKEFNNKPAIEEFKNTFSYKTGLIPKSGFSKDFKVGTASFLKSIGISVTEGALSEVVKSPLATADKEGEFFITMPIRKDGKSIEFTNKIGEQALLRKMDADIEEVKQIDENIYLNMEKSLKNLGFMIDVNCSLRKILLGNEFYDKLSEKIKKENKPPFIGFFGYGEYGSTRGVKNNYFSITHSTMFISNDLVVK